MARVPADLDRDAFEAEIHDFLADYGMQSLNQFDVSGALNGITTSSAVIICCCRRTSLCCSRR